MRMDKIAGHDKVKKLLDSIISSGHIGHAYIFEGAEGVGRLSLATAFAEKLCGGASAENNPDIIVVTNELYDSSKKQKNVLIDTIRSMKADVYIKPFLSDRKVYIIPNADTMQEPAQNSLLKVFEEPPEYCTVILIASNANALLQTIRSRAAMIRISPLLRDEVENYLIENNIADAHRAKVISAMSGGSIGKALEFSADAEAVALRDTVIGHLVGICGKGAKSLYDFVKFLKQNNSDIKTVLDIMAGWSEDILHIKVCGDYDVTNADKIAELKRVSMIVTAEAAYHFCEIVTKYSLAISRNANYSAAVLCMATEYWEEIHGRNYRSAL